LRLAEQLGAEALTRPGSDEAEEIVRVATSSNVTHIIAGTPKTSGWREWLHGSVTSRLIRRAGNISVHVIAGDDREGEAVATRCQDCPGFNPVQDQALCARNDLCRLCAWRWLSARPVA
jgi:two-component system sensor histidine kinase KdpD